MSAIGDKDLVRVRSHDELRAGMTVVRVSCPCGKARHVSMLLRVAAPTNPPHHLRSDGIRERCYAETAWIESNPHRPTWTCFCYVLAEGRLYRLRDLDDSKADSVATRRPVATPVKI